ncbi:hypothetical protein C8J44_1099 [Sphingomonas sp. PP-CE-3A-406]|nr:hypothetical protein C8J44_1099 [Sphingomonas sp. PP-CE-3A-406]
MAGCGQQYALDLTARSAGTPVAFEQACACSAILCAPADAGRRFADWIRCDVNGLEQDAQLNVIASFRLLIRRLASINPVSRSIAAAISRQFAAWLEQADHPAAQAHVADLLSVAD